MHRGHVGVAGLCLACAIAALGPGCGGDDGGDGEADVFIAFERDFQAFRTWETFPLGTQEPQELAHLKGMRTDFINRRPPRGATGFAVGTIIVKEVIPDESTDRQMFAAVKRGGGYNPDGAVGWEWFELGVRAD